MATYPTYPIGYGFLDRAFTLSPLSLGNQPSNNFSADGLPEGLTINSVNGVISGTITAFPDNYNNLFVVSYDSGVDSRTVEVTINIVNVVYPTGMFYSSGFPFNASPTIAGSFIPNIFALNELPHPPGNITFNTSNGDIGSGINNVYGAGTGNLFTVRVTAPDATYANYTFNLDGVMAAYEDTPYIFGAGSEVNIVPTSTVNVEAYAFGDGEGGGDPLPDGLSFDYTSGAITGSTILTGVYNFKVYYYGSMGYSYPASITVTIGVDCLRGDARVLTINGYKPMNTLTVDDYIITDKRIVRKVKDIYTVNFTGNLYCIKKNTLTETTPLNDVYLSGNHQFMHKGRVYKPRKYLPKTTINDILLYHVDLENENEYIIVEGVPMESHHKHISDL